MKRLLITALLAVALPLGVYNLPQSGRSRLGSLTDAELEELSLALSEEPGNFDTDNLISNELSYSHVLGRLERNAPPGEVYIGVGPDQNFSYIDRIRPIGAFIVDLRRENLLQHLYLKQLMESSENRWEYLLHLFGRQAQGSFGGGSQQEVVQLLDRLRELPADSAFFETAFLKLWESLRGRFPELIRASDRETFRGIAEAFFKEGLELRFRSHGRRPRSYYPTYEQLLLEGDEAGEIGSYLSSEGRFQFLRRMQLENRIIPVVGDLAGPDALSRIGAYLRSQGRSVSAIYVSNVEFYLFQEGRFGAYMENLSRLPRGPDSLVIRSYFNYRRRHPETRAGYYVTSLLQRIGELVRLYSGNPGLSYWELVASSYIPSEK